MNKDNGRVVDLEELKNLSIVGGNDNGGDGDITPYFSTSVVCSVTVSITVVSMVVSQTASCAEVCWFYKV